MSDQSKEWRARVRHEIADYAVRYRCSLAWVVLPLNVRRVIAEFEGLNAQVAAMLYAENSHDSVKRAGVRVTVTVSK